METQELQEIVITLSATTGALVVLLIMSLISFKLHLNKYYKNEQ